MNRSLQRFEWVDNAKGIGIVLIVYLHVINGLDAAFYGQVTENQFWGYSQSLIRTFHMPLFFFLSGLFVNTSISKYGNKSFIINKVKSIIWPYFVWSFIQGSIHILFSSYTNNNSTFSQLLFFIFFNPFQQLWFLYVLFLYFMFYVFVGKWHKTSFIFACIMYLCSGFAPALIVGKIMHYYLFFIIGSMSLNYLIKVISYDKFRYFLYPCCLLLIAKVLFKFDGNVVSYFLFACIGIILILSFTQFFKGKNTFLIKELGFLSLQIFAAHVVFAAGTRIFLLNVLGIDSISLHVVLGTLNGILFPCLLYYVTNRFDFPYLFTFKTNLKTLA